MRHLQALILAFLLLISSAFAEMSDFTGTPAIPINNGIPNFTEDDISDYAYVLYSGLDDLGRVGISIACIGPEFPIGARSSISNLAPSGWQNKQYDFIPGGYLYNRSHLIAHRFSGGGEVIDNLFTGTQYLNQNLMAQVETVVANYVERTGNHVLYRVTPDFRGNELVCRGVEIEAQSVEDMTVQFHIYLYNIQPGVAIDYSTGESRVSDTKFIRDTTKQSQEDQIEEDPEKKEPPQDQITLYVLNTNTKRFHLPDCHSVTDMKPKNRKDYTGTREELIEQGYKPCGECKP